ncbi:DUF4302 domain-containing protein [Ornithobacterium rhinotracheale]|uniref:DUF4302 domain-containing protein n=1 Tax=Ornithobacterium rhinotracheale TaxID=28251 RepID=UPI00129CFB43|nr:DUF4302 domain-containing protein [Ornithobacterium rhinotracheale]MRJ10412.1 DUF4302 domain-containing protein [Ornithobacterium rhinotracheale]
MKKILYISLLIPFLGTLNSCVEDFESNFSENTTERYLNAEREYLDYLKTPGANFVFQYYPDDNQSYGGYNYFLKFTEDNHVIAEDEASTPPQESTFRVLQSGGAVLSFDLYNKDLHKFATPSGSEYRAKRGDFEFLILRKSNDTLYLKGRKTGNYLKIFKVADINTVKNNIRETVGVLSKIDLPTTGTIAGEPLDVQVSGERNLLLNYQLSGKQESENVSYIHTEDGIQFYEPIEVNGKKYTNLIYNSAARTLKSEDEVIVINLKFLPINFKTKSWILDFSNDDNTSDGYKLARKGDELIHNIILKQFKLQPYYVLGKFGDNTSFTTFLGEPAESVGYGLTFRGDDTNSNLIYIEKTKPLDFEVYFRYISNVLDKIANNSPYIVEPDNPMSPKRVKLINQKDPTLWFYLDAL